LSVALVFGAGCASSHDAIRASAQYPEQIRWPEAYTPEEASFFVHNAITIEAPPEVVWNILIEAETWPEWYEGAANVDVQGDSPRLHPGAVFTWRTMGLDFTSTITEFEPYTRLSWESVKTVITGYHGWLIIPTDTGCTLITDESQNGFLTFLERIFQPTKLHGLHDIWLAEIKSKAEAIHRAQTQGEPTAGP
ncbi:MAG: SRPBCC family protein, partial [Myxococcota bacterium]